jgi:hypothetical protein
MHKGGCSLCILAVWRNTRVHSPYFVHIEDAALNNVLAGADAAPENALACARAWSRVTPDGPLENARLKP